MLQLGIELAERGWVPDSLLRHGMRRLCDRRLKKACSVSAGNLAQRDAEFARSCRQGPLAPLPSKANDQHYEVDAEFFEYVLGPRRKYSSCYWPEDCPSLAAAEEHALRITCERAELADGMSILELGCGWGSLTLWMAEHYPTARITAVSNSNAQRQAIERFAKERGLENRIRVVTADMNDYQASDTYDRVVSVEMFEHMRNLELLLRRISQWLTPAGKLFVHVFCHRAVSYPFETQGAANWMGRYFFTGGMMPSANLLGHFSQDLSIAKQWTWNGRHYRQTAEAWVANMADHRDPILAILARSHGKSQAERWFQRWRMLFLAGAELFGFDEGREWFVSHYLLERTEQTK